MLEGSNLLSQLRGNDLAILADIASETYFRAGDTFYEPGDWVDHCYFPSGGAIGSYLVPGAKGEAVEIVMIGREGAIGGIVSNGQLPSYARAVVMHEGHFYKIPIDKLEEAKRQSAGIRHLFDRYADCLMAQVFQSIACNATHTIEQRAAKWLVAAIDQAGQFNITMTQEQLASMMGIGRSYASRVIQRFKRDGLLNTRRGGFKVLDRGGLADRSCNCDALVRDHFGKVLGGVYPDG